MVLFCLQADLYSPLIFAKRGKEDDTPIQCLLGSWGEVIFFAIVVSYEISHYHTLPYRTSLDWVLIAAQYMHFQVSYRHLSTLVGEAWNFPYYSLAWRGWNSIIYKALLRHKCISQAENHTSTLTGTKLLCAGHLSGISWISCSVDVLISWSFAPFAGMHYTDWDGCPSLPVQLSQCWTEKHNSSVFATARDIPGQYLIFHILSKMNRPASTQKKNKTSEMAALRISVFLMVIS